MFSLERILRRDAAEIHDEFNYDMRSNKGPIHWGEVKPEWSQCNNGSMQSPIHLTNKTIQTLSALGPLQLNYTKTNATFVNRGHDIMLRFNAPKNYLKLNGTQYLLKQCHWHSPAEHTMDGKRFGLEFHMVHQTPSGQTAVLAILYRVSEKADAFLELEGSVTREQLRLLQHPLRHDSKANARPVQPLNNRLVQLNLLKDMVNDKH
ncbi:hypothetical protein Fmac_022012 [Flemingia macrophylla]|uniref:Alpha-carbonic anhydrase domain-containing protein n=1 Tax=Flemingia macrophylla TaxID=520843 RepID=A0ABD1LYJ1_9FABA